MLHRQNNLYINNNLEMMEIFNEVKNYNFNNLLNLQTN